MLDEVASAGRENLDAAHVERYDVIEDAGAHAEVETLRGLGLGTDAVVVEIGAGTGQFAMAVAGACARVIAVDVSTPMLTRLRTKVASCANIEVREGGFLTYEHEGDPADVVYTRYALHHLPDFWKAVALARIHDMLRPGGLLRVWDVVYSFSPREADEVLEAWCSTGGADGDAGAWSRADYEEHVRDEHSTYSWLFEAMCREVGFTIEEADYSADRMFAQYVLRRA